MKFNNICEHLDIIKDIFIQKPEDEAKVLSKLDMSEKEFNDLASGEKEPDKIQLENIYNFAYNNGLYLNEIRWQDRLDEFRGDSVSVCSHGSRRNIEGPIRVDIQSDSSDFGSGFYVGQSIDQAGMWVAQEPDSSLYIFTFNEEGLKRAQFNVSIDWMLTVCTFRNQLDKYKDHKIIKNLLDKVNNCDYVLAPIADNKLFEVMDAFAAEEITDLQCLYALSATHLGYQFVLKTPKAVENLSMKDHLYFSAVEKSIYNHESDSEENVALYKAFMAKKRYKDQGRYISEIFK